MSFWKAAVITLLALTSVGTAQAAYFDFNLDGNSFRAIYAENVEFERIKIKPDLELGYLYSQDPADADHMLNIGLVSTGENYLQGSRSSVRMGGRGIIARALNEHIFAFGLGGRVSYHPISLDLWSFTTELYYAPQVTSFIDGKSYLEFSTRASYHVFPQSSFYIGWTRVNVQLELNGSTTLYNDLHFGMAFEF